MIRGRLLALDLCIAPCSGSWPLYVASFPKHGRGRAEPAASPRRCCPYCQKVAATNANHCCTSVPVRSINGWGKLLWRTIKGRLARQYFSLDPDTKSELERKIRVPIGQELHLRFVRNNPTSAGVGDAITKPCFSRRANSVRATRTIAISVFARLPQQGGMINICPNLENCRVLQWFTDKLPFDFGTEQAKQLDLLSRTAPKIRSIRILRQKVTETLPVFSCFTHVGRERVRKTLQLELLVGG